MRVAPCPKINLTPFHGHGHIFTAVAQSVHWQAKRAKKYNRPKGEGASPVARLNRGVPEGPLTQPPKRQTEAPDRSAMLPQRARRIRCFT
jgi:hypothetical protein